MADAAKVGSAVHNVPVMLDPAGVFAHEVGGEFLQRGLRGFQVTPRAGLSQTGDAGVGLDLHE